MMSRRTKLTAAAIVVGLAFSSVASATEKIEYTYDARGRLVKVKRDPAQSTVNANVQACYKYDKAGNRTNVTTSLTSPLPPCP
jgi:YD repeat-containing protein